MPRLVGVRERRHQYYYDTLIRADTNTAPNPTVVQQTRLFNGVNLGSIQWTNMAAAGTMGSDNTFVVLALRVWLWFVGQNALIQYQLAVHQMYCALTAGDKSLFLWQAWYTPAGGGIFGFDSATPAMNNGVPQQSATLKLAKAIPIPARQSFYVQVDLFDTGATSLRTTFLNAAGSIGMREIKVALDGIHTRDVL
jgi:hypothetical protein